MKCAKCNKESKINTPFGERNYCDKHFIQAINKRVRKDLRINQKIDVKKKYNLKKSNSHEYHLTKYFLDNIFNNHLNYSDKTSKNLIISKSLDEKSSEFLKTFLDDKKEPKEVAITPLRSVLQVEMKELCRILKLNFKHKNHNQILDNLEKQYPGTKFSVLRSEDFLNKKI